MENLSLSCTTSGASIVTFESDQFNIVFAGVDCSTKMTKVTPIASLGQVPYKSDANHHFNHEVGAWSLFVSNADETACPITCDLDQTYAELSISSNNIVKAKENISEQKTLTAVSISCTTTAG